MKKFYIIFFIILISTALHAQPWAQVGASWCYKDGDDAQIGYSGYIEVNKVGDTLVNGILCDNLTAHHVGIMWWNGQTYNYYYSNQFTYISNDTVYYWQNNQFNVLYVFSAQQNDYWITGEGYHGGCDGDTIVVDSAQMVTVNGINMRRIVPVPYGTIWFPNGGASIYLHQPIYERFGSLAFLFPIEACMTDVPVPQLRFHSDSSGFNFSTNIAPYCEYIIGINENNFSKAVAISPNPASTEFQISNFNFQVNDEIILRNVLGEIYFSKKITSPTSNFKLQTSNFTNGIYFLEIKTKEGVLNRKVVVQH